MKTVLEYTDKNTNLTKRAVVNVNRYGNKKLTIEEMTLLFELGFKPVGRIGLIDRPWSNGEFFIEICKSQSFLSGANTTDVMVYSLKSKKQIMILNSIHELSDINFLTKHQ